MSGGQIPAHAPLQVLAFDGSEDSVYSVSPFESTRYVPNVALVRIPIWMLDGAAIGVGVLVAAGVADGVG
jgi:hypothetical protein